MLEWKIRCDLKDYESAATPKLNIKEITDYLPKYNPRGGGDGWENLFHRLWNLSDDGHAPKFVRAVAHGEQICMPYENDSNFPVKADMWLTIANMIVDSVEVDDGKDDGEERWIRTTGDPDAWRNVPDRQPVIQRR
jgi:hypothetical protein